LEAVLEAIGPLGTLMDLARFGGSFLERNFG
jgi:hypothetical protein